jgi:small subunit ribosomal protein S13
MRIAGVTLPDDKMIAYSLHIIVGIGPARARDILKQLNIAPNTKGTEITPDQEQAIRTLAESFTIEGELRREVSQNIKRLKDIRADRGIRHERRLPARGGRTKTNSRTVRGNTRKTMGSGRRSLEKT